MRTERRQVIRPRLPPADVPAVLQEFGLLHEVPQHFPPVRSLADAFRGDELGCRILGGYQTSMVLIRSNSRPPSEERCLCPALCSQSRRHTASQSCGHQQICESAESAKVGLRPRPSATSPRSLAGKSLPPQSHGLEIEVQVGGDELVLLSTACS